MRALPRAVSGSRANCSIATCREGMAASLAGVTRALTVTVSCVRWRSREVVERDTVTPLICGRVRRRLGVRARAK